jgi:2,3-bisphosphoglycerate-dependent phosphoglycerate mutase
MNHTTTLLVARHGNTFGPGDVVTRVGTTDLALVDSGLMQGRLLGLHLKKHHLLPDVIFTSTLKRTIQTAEQAQLMMHTQLPIQPLSIFNEIDYGPDENQPEKDVIARLGATALTAWENHAEVPNGWRVDPFSIIQHWQDFSNQLINFHAGQTILVVTSNGIARFAPYLTGDYNAFTKKYELKIATGALCVFKKEPCSERWNCLEWNVRPKQGL